MIIVFIMVNVDVWHSLKNNSTENFIIFSKWALRQDVFHFKNDQSYSANAEHEYNPPSQFQALILRVKYISWPWKETLKIWTNRVCVLCQLANDYKMTWLISVYLVSRKAVHSVSDKHIIFHDNATLTEVIAETSCSCLWQSFMCDKNINLPCSLGTLWDIFA